MRPGPALAASLLVVTAALAGCVGPQGAEPTVNNVLGQLPFVRDLVAAGPVFGAEVVVDNALGGSEPSLVVDPEGRIFVAAPTGLLNAQDQRFSGQFWRSEDDGLTFEHLPGLGVGGLYGTSFGGGDSDIATDAQGNLYAIDLWLGNVGFLSSTDHGDTWQGSPVTFAASGTDRQWVEVNQATGEVYVTVNSLSTGLWVAKSADSGLTFPQQTLAVPHADRGGCICPPGAFTVDEATGNIYLPYYINPNGVGVAISTDGGASFTPTVVPGTEGSALPDDEGGEIGGPFTVITHDTAGNLYLVWEEVTDAGRRIVLQTSPDQGQSWSEPRRIRDGAMTAQLMPWVVAGEAGRVAVAWYEVDEAMDWDVVLAFSETALSASPVFAFSQLNAAPIHNGGYERSLVGDFFEIAMDAQGGIHAVWNANLDGAEAIVYAQQVDGPRLLTGAAAMPAAPAKAPGIGEVPVKPSDPKAVGEAFAAEGTKELRELVPVEP